MQKPKFSVAIVCDPDLSASLSRLIPPESVRLRPFTSLAAALKERKNFPFEALLIEEKKATKNAVSQITRLEDPLATIVAIAHGRPLRNAAYWKALDPFILLDPSDKNADPLAAISQACRLTRKAIRLQALRQHHERSLNLGNNPALELISELIHACSTANEYASVLAAARVLAPAIDFHECHLILCQNDREARVFSGTSDEGEIAENKVPQAPVAALARLPIPQNSAALVLRDQSAGDTLSGFLLHPWNSAVVMKFAVGGSGRPAPAAYLAFVRTDLMTFTERDRWLLEIAYGPIAVSLEKVRFLEIIGNRGREWRSTFDAISEPISVIDADYRIIRANRAFADAVGGDVRALKGKHCFTIFARKKRPCASCPVSSSRKRKQPGARIKGKRNRDYLAWSYPLAIDKGGLRIQFYRNVSKEAQLTAALIQSEKMAALGSLISAIAHEINNPLAGILATSQILLRSGPDPALPSAALDDVREIESAARRSKEIIDNLLGFSSDYRRNPMSLLEAVNSVLLFAKTALKHVSTQIDVPPDIRITATNASSVQQILFNLVTNAAHAMPNAGNLYISSQASGRNVRITVRDTGKGIAKENLPKIFEPFFTQKSEGRGTGLGLSIVRTLLARMNGNIEVNSAVGVGTAFTLDFPNDFQVERNPHA